MTVRVESHGHVRIITIDRPEARNAINRETRAGLEEAFTAFVSDDAARVAVLTGAGDKAFSAGADLKEMNPDKPIVAAINGGAFGGGLEMVLACDLRIAADHVQMGLTESRWALLPGGGGTQRLAREIPRAIALEMLMTGAPIPAARAYELGLVNAVVPSAELMTRALQLAETIAANGPLAVRAAKKAVDEGADLPLEEALALEQRLSKTLFATSDAAEGPRAFAEKRPPRFEAR